MCDHLRNTILSIDGIIKIYLLCLLQEFIFCAFKEKYFRGAVTNPIGMSLDSDARTLIIIGQMIRQICDSSQRFKYFYLLNFKFHH